ncbi:MAG: hypothetical protein JNM44_02640 [Chitinophagaceae bacterium]|nr:hypothetical protein [Chitinophagaceae bacterium]
MKPSTLFTKRMWGLDQRVLWTLALTAGSALAFILLKWLLVMPCQGVVIQVNDQDPNKQNYLYANTPIRFSVAGAQQTDRITWLFGDHSKKVSGNPMLHYFREEGDYTVTAILSGGCELHIDVHIRHQLTLDNLGSNDQLQDGNPINGMDQPKAGEVASFFCAVAADAYEWTVPEDPAIAVGTSNLFQPVFLSPGLYTVQLKLNNDPKKVFRKQVSVQAGSPAGASGMELPATGPAPAQLAPVSPNLPPPSALPAAEEEENAEAAPAPAKREPLIVADEELKYQLDQIRDKKKSILDLKDYFCDGYETNVKVQSEGKVINLQQLCDKLQGKTGLLGLGGRPKVKSVRSTRDPESHCIVVLYVDTK